MGKSKSFQGREAFQRMNFLFQASEFLVSRLNQPHLAAYYGSQMTSICKKSVLRMEPRVKRQLCKGCRAPLIPGISSQLRLKSRSKNMTVTCVQCGTIKRFPMKAGYKLWVETPEACVQTFSTECVEHSENKNEVAAKGEQVKKQSECKNQPKEKCVQQSENKEGPTVDQSQCESHTETSKELSMEQELNMSKA